MTSSGKQFPLENNNPILSWEFLLLKILLLALTTVLLAKPAGSICGQIAMEQEGFNLFSYDMKKNNVYAVAIGPHEGQEQERGVWIGKDGKFQINQLPIGEYSLRIRVPGFSTTYENGIFVEESKVTMLPQSVKLEISHPSVNIASNTRVFTSKEAPRFWVNASSATSLKVKVYKKDLLEVLRAGRDHENLGIEISPELSLYKAYSDDNTKKKSKNLFASMEPMRTWERSLRPDCQDWAHEEFKFSEPLPPGDYFASAEVVNTRGEIDSNMIWFSVSDIGLIVKQDQEQTLVRAIDLNTLRPQPNVDLVLFDHYYSNERVISPSCKAKTGQDGFARINLPAEYRGNTTLLVTGFLDKQHAYGGLSIYQSAADFHRTYFYSERPVYRLGQTVYFKTICRDLEDGGLKNPGQNQVMTVVIEDPDNQKLIEQTYKTNAHGTFNGSFVLPQDGKTGAYQLAITYPDGSVNYQRVEAAEYRKPEYQVDVISLNERVIAGNKARARVKANYYFGAPVTHAKIKYSIYSAYDWSTRYKLTPRPDYYAFFDDWSEGSDYNEGGDFIKEGYAETDDTGEAIIEFDTKAIANSPDAVFSDAYSDRKYRIEAEVTDISRLSVLSSGSIPVTVGDIELFIQPTSSIITAGEVLSSDVTVVDYHGDPAANIPVHLSLMRRPWDRVKSEYKNPQLFEETNVTTDASGKAHVSFNTKAKFESDTYYIVGSCLDNQKHHIMSETSIWVASENFPYVLNDNEAKKEPLSVRLDKQVYRAGEKAKVMITAPVTGQEGAQAIVSIEGSKLHSYQIVEMKSSATVVEIPINKSYAPNVYVTATFVGKKHQFYSQTQMIKVSPLDRFLNISVNTDKPKYKPGETAKYTIKALHSDGKPAANTELSLGIVDESIYAIRPEYAQNICKFFYDQRANLVSTSCSFPEEYSGGPNKIEPRVRKDFKDTALWIPSLLTNSDGIATAVIKMPDNLTTWRATVRGINLTADVGSTVQKVVSTQDLIVRLALPRFFCQGDQGQITAIVHNYSDTAQDVRLDLLATNQFKIQKQLREQIKIEPDKAARVSWPIDVLTSGTATIGVKAVGQTAGDAMEVKLPIRPLGVPVFLTASGVSEGEDETVSSALKYPDDAAPGSVKSTVCLSSSSLGPILGNFSALIDYPYGCTEQTMSKLMPSVVAVKMHKSIGIPLAASDITRFQKVYKESMSKLDDYQHGDGGWGWWANDQSTPYLTALVLEGYSLLKENGYKIDPLRAQNATKWLSKTAATMHKQLSDPQLLKDTTVDREVTTDLAKAVYVLNTYKLCPSSQLRSWLQKESVRNKLSPEALSYLCMALPRETPLAQSLYHRLINLANIATDKRGGLMNWERSMQMLHKLGSPEQYYSYRFTGVETTALALRACVYMEPSNSDRIESIKRWILTQRGKDGWGNTKTTAEVFRAFTEVEVARSDSGDTEFNTTILLSQGTPTTVHFGKDSAFAAEESIPIDLKPGKENPLLHKSGKGKLYWTQTLSYYKNIKPGENALLKSSPDGLSLKRAFYRLIPQAPDSEGRIHFNQVPLNGPVKAGETLLMKVLIDSPTSIPYTIIEAALPSGAEVVEHDSKDALSSEDNDGKAITTDFGAWWWTHQDILDDHMAYFSTNFPANKHEIHTMVRLELPGKFQMNPVTLEGMYTNSVRGYSQADMIEVRE